MTKDGMTYSAPCLFPTGAPLMELSEYFEKAKGLGVLATVNGCGHVDTALYSRPHFLEDGTVAFVMKNRLSHANLQANPFASYLFVEKGPGYQGKRLYLRKIGEEQETERLYNLRHQAPPDVDPRDNPRFLVFFELEKVRSLVGDSEYA
jgi:hypothetical protein